MAVKPRSRMAAGASTTSSAAASTATRSTRSWLVPHFEKMLYDNAELSRAVPGGLAGDGRRRATAAIVEGDARLRPAGDDCARRRVLLRRRTPTARARRASSSSGTSAEVKALVDPADVDLVCRYWDITDEGNFEGKSIAHVTVTVEQVARLCGRSPESAAASIDEAQRRLFAARSLRVPPARDEKMPAPAGTRS